MFHRMRHRHLFTQLPIALLALAVLASGCTTTGGTTSSGTTAASGISSDGGVVSGSISTPADTLAGTEDRSYPLQTFPYARAYMTLVGTTAELNIPQEAQARVLAYSWGGARPRVVPEEADSLGTPLQIPGATPTLNIQKREDALSPFLLQLFEQQIPINQVNFTIDPQTAPATSYALYGVTIASMRTVGPQTSPVTEELVLVFGRIEQLPTGRASGQSR